MVFNLVSTAFEHGESIPIAYTCEGKDVSPPLDWPSPPPGTKSFALIVDDPDAPDPKAPQRTWVHWVLYDLPASTHHLPEGIEHLPHGTHEGRNDWSRTGYGGPCPPIGRHRYFFKLYALDALLGELHKPDKAALLDAMTGHILAQATLMGTYEKQRR
jgi:Raf kinase inhibitor-like YbhB/YbcL family protein